MPDLQAIFRLIESKRKSSFPWKRQEPYEQPYFLHNDSTKSWEPARPSPSHSSSPVSTFDILSWNIDFMLPFPNQRMQVALNHLNSLVSASQHPSIIFLNECLVSDLQLIQSQPWIQQSYHITDLNDEYWESGYYGTTTLIAKSLPISKVFRVHYEATKMERDLLCVDLSISNKIVRVCNSHLESLIADPPIRPKQVETASTFMHAPEVHASVIGGDFNAIQPFDRTLHSDNNLRDAYLGTGGEEDSDEGYTWGQMAPVKQREMFGCSRMDKLFYCGGVELVEFKRFGLGVKVDDDEIEKELMEKEGLDGGWVTDHAGVKGVFRIVEKDESETGGKEGQRSGSKI